MVGIAFLFLAVLAIAPQSQNSADPVEVSFYFERGSDQLTAAGLQLADALVEVAGPRRPVRVYLEGHTSTIGDDADNMDLSLRRAMALRDALIARGIPDNIVHVEAFGEGVPARLTADGVHEPQNDRVVVRIPAF